MTKYIIGAVGALMAALAGAWLMLAPFALAYQNSGADWADPTYVDFWTGLPLVVISVVGLILFILGLVEELRRRGILQRPYAVPAGQPQPAGAPADPTGNATGQQGNMEQVLLPLITAMLKDMQERDHARDNERDSKQEEVHRTAPNNAQQPRSVGEEGSVKR
ncbi:MAG TPA: hypothetical protein VFJ72_09780 [Rubrobacteraceae bacterium]|nr:hypothetical protein [Rubrobacteraceae bacterium]